MVSEMCRDVFWKSVHRLLLFFWTNNVKVQDATEVAPIPVSAIGADTDAITTDTIMPIPVIYVCI